MPPSIETTVTEKNSTDYRRNIQQEAAGYFFTFSVFSFKQNISINLILKQEVKNIQGISIIDFFLPTRKTVPRVFGKLQVVMQIRVELTGKRVKYVTDKKLADNALNLQNCTDGRDQNNAEVSRPLKLSVCTHNQLQMTRANHSRSKYNVFFSFKNSSFKRIGRTR